MATLQQNSGTGRRKTSAARVFLRKGSGAIVVNGNVTRIKFRDLRGGKYAVQSHSLDNVEMVRKFFVNQFNLLLPTAARVAKQLVFNQGDGSAHEATSIVVGNSSLGRGNNEISSKRDGNKRTHREQIEVEEKLG